MSRGAPRFLFVIRTGPGGDYTLAETLDMILTCAAFDHSVRLLFIDEGVRHLRGCVGTVPPSEERERGMLASLDLYEVREVLVGRESLAARGLSERDCPIAVTLWPESAIAGLIAEHDRIQVA